MSATTLPDVVARLRPIVETLPDEARPFLMAQLERGAAARYRSWADEAPRKPLAIGLRLCAQREESIAEIIEQIFPITGAHAAGLEAAGQQLKEAGDPFAGFSLAQCLKMQSVGERGGAAAWREIAASSNSAEEREALEICARFEEENANFLEATAEVSGL